MSVCCTICPVKGELYNGINRPASAAVCYKPGMTRRTTTDSRQTAEMAFKTATTRPVEALPKTPALPGAKELVSLRIDRDVLDHFQQDGPGWQERINDALRKAAGK